MSEWWSKATTMINPNIKKEGSGWSPWLQTKTSSSAKLSKKHFLNLCNIFPDKQKNQEHNFFFLFDQILIQ